MAFSLSSGAPQNDVVDAINYLLSNFKGTISADNVTGQVTGPDSQVIAYLYKFLAVKYADNITGQLNFSNSPTNRLYYGLRNTNSNIESTDPQDYVWTQVTGGFGTTKFFWYSVTGGRQILIKVSVTKPEDGYVQDNGNAIDLDIITTPSFSPVSWVLFRVANDSSAPTNAESQFALNRNPITGDICTINFNAGTQSIQYQYGTSSWTILNRYITGDLIKNLVGLDCAIETVTHIDFNTALTAPSYKAGRVWYDQSTNTLSYNNTVLGTTIHLGTNSISAPVAGTVAYGTGTALAYTAVGTSGQVLTSAGAGVPTWTTPLTTGTSTSILYGNGTGGFSNVTIGSGVTFVGGTLSATGAGGTVTSVTGTAPIASSGGATPAISISQSSGTTNGYLSFTDWTTFNNKQPGGTYVTAVTASGNIASSGGTTPAITFTGILPIANGGTNTTATPTLGGVTYGTGTAQAYTSTGSTGQFLTSAGGAAPTWTSATALAGAIGYYGAYHDTSTVTATSTTVAYVMNIGSIDLQNGFSVVGGTKVTAANAGIYNFQFSAQLSNPNSAIADVSVWIRINGVNVTDGAGTNGVPGKHGSNNGLQIISWNYVLSLAAADYIELVWHSDITGVQLITFPATVSPATPQSPSLIVTIGAQSQIGIGYYGQTSLTSTTIGTGSKTFTVGIPATSSAFTVGTRVRFAYTTTPSNFMEGVITSFATTSMVVNVDLTGGSGTYAAWAVSIAGNQGTGAVTSVTGTAPVVSSGGTTPAISMPAATTSVSGYLTSTDWTTFNNKQSAGTYVTSISVASSNGLAGTSSGGATPALTLSTSVTGVLKGNGTSISAAIANTDYVPVSTVLTQTADYTITNTDTWIINNKSGSAMVLTFPTASLWPGRSVTVKNLQVQAVNSATSNIVPIDSITAGTSILLPVIGNWSTVVSDGTNWVTMAQAPNNILLLE